MNCWKQYITNKHMVGKN